MNRQMKSPSSKKIVWKTVREDGMVLSCEIAMSCGKWLNGLEDTQQACDFSGHVIREMVVVVFVAIYSIILNIYVKEDTLHWILFNILM